MYLFFIGSSESNERINMALIGLLAKVEGGFGFGSSGRADLNRRNILFIRTTWRSRSTKTFQYCSQNLHFKSPFTRSQPKRSLMILFDKSMMFTWWSKEEIGTCLGQSSVWLLPWTGHRERSPEEIKIQRYLQNYNKYWRYKTNKDKLRYKDTQRIIWYTSFKW